MSALEVVAGWMPLAKVAKACGVHRDRVRKYANAAIAKGSGDYMRDGENSRAPIYVSESEVERLKSEVWPISAMAAVS